MSRLTGFPTNNPDARKLQIRIKGKAVEIVDKESQQLMSGVTHWEVDTQSGIAIAKVQIAIDSADIFVSDEVEGSIVHPIAGLPERIELRRQVLAELAQIAQDSGFYD